MKKAKMRAVSNPLRELCSLLEGAGARISFSRYCLPFWTDRRFVPLLEMSWRYAKRRLASATRRSNLRPRIQSRVLSSQLQAHRSAPEEAEMRKHKYRAKPTVVDNVRFASKKEALYYMQLKALLRTKEISDLELQPKFKIPPDGYEFADGTPAGGKICVYQADFRYKNKAGESVVVDTKGYKTREYRLKIKLMRYFWPWVEVVEA